MKKFYLIAGEASGDLHGHNLVKSIKNQMPDCQFRGVGGDLMESEGVKLHKHIRETNFMGFIEVIWNLRKILGILKAVKKDILTNKPDAIILIDYPGFNLRIAQFAKKLGIQVFYYISPQLWAWKKGRINIIKNCVDKLFVILPFEKEFYQKEKNIQVDFVGHPLLDAISQYQNTAENLRKELNLNDKPILAVLPGSRVQEIKKMLPAMLKAANKIPDIQIIVAGAPNQPKSLYDTYIKGTSAHFVSNRTYDVLKLAHTAVVTSGTATLETALFGVPEVVCYKGGWLSFQIAKRLVSIRFISLVNLILNQAAVVELIQNEMNEQNIYKELQKLMYDSTYRIKVEADLLKLQTLLGGVGASDRTAALIIKYLK